MRAALAACCLLFSLPGLRAAASYTAHPGPYQVATTTFDWIDASRRRSVPVRIYYPLNSPAPSPVIVFSHGLGGTRDGYEYVGRHWASYGYVCVHVQHLGSDDAVWRGSASPMQSLKTAITKIENTTNRPQDISFAIDQLTALAAQDPAWHARLDLAHIGVAGHSYGANTSLIIGGQKVGRKSYRDPRVQAVIAMCAPAPRLPNAFDSFAVPVFHLTGTLDDSPIGETTASQRRIPFDAITSVDEYLLTLTGADHMTFGGPRPGKAARPSDLVFHDLVKAGTTAFWDAYLRHDAQARHWLRDGGYAALVAANGKLEIKPPAPQ